MKRFVLFAGAARYHFPKHWCSALRLLLYHSNQEIKKTEAAKHIASQLRSFPLAYKRHFHPWKHGLHKHKRELYRQNVLAPFFYIIYYLRVNPWLALSAHSVGNKVPHMRMLGLVINDRISWGFAFYHQNAHQTAVVFILVCDKLPELFHYWFTVSA